MIRKNQKTLTDGFKPLYLNKIRTFHSCCQTCHRKVENVHFDSFFLIQYFSNVKISIFRFSFCLFRLQKLIMTFFMTLSIIFSSSVILLVNSKAWVTIFRSIVVKCEASKTTMRHRNSNLHHFSTMCILAPPSGGHDHSKLLV